MCIAFQKNKIQKMEFKLIFKRYLNLFFKIKFHLKIKLFMKMYKHCSPTHKYGGNLFLSA